MKIRLFLLIFLLLQVISCEPDEDYYTSAYITIINNSERNITWVTVVNAKTGYPAVSERHNKLIEKDDSKTFEIGYEVGDYKGGDYTVCLKTEDTSEFMCVAKFSLKEDQKISFIWGGDNSSIWQPRLSSANDKKCDEKEYDAETYFCDPRDSKIYKFVEIDNQFWMAQNLNYDAPNSECYTRIIFDCWYNCNSYVDPCEDRLYDYDKYTFMQICPVGWHLPSDDEWTALTDFLGSNAGTKLKSKDYNGTDDFGFAAIPINPSESIAGGWWSSTGPTHYCPDDPLVACAQPAPGAYIRLVSYESSDVFREFSYGKLNAVRCVKSSPQLTPQ